MPPKPNQQQPPDSSLSQLRSKVTTAQPQFAPNAIIEEAPELHGKGLNPAHAGQVVFSGQNSFMLQKLYNMLKHTSEQDDIKEYAKQVIEERNKVYFDRLITTDGLLKEEERDIDPILRKWRLDERKVEIKERISQLQIKEILPRNQVQNKLKELEKYSSTLEEKQGDKEVEEKMGLKLSGKYHTIAHMDDPLPGELSVRKTYEEKKIERDEGEKKVQGEIDTFLSKIREEKKARKDKERKEKIQKLVDEKKSQESTHQKKKDKELLEIEKTRQEIKVRIASVTSKKELAFSTMLENTKKINKNPIFRQYTERYREVEEEEVEKRKDHLKSMRELNKPQNHEELLEHSKKVEELTKATIEKRKAERAEKIKKEQMSYDYSKYHTKFLDQVLEQESARQEEKDRKEEQRIKKPEQRDVYDKYVKEMHWPKISEKKKAELETLKLTLKTSPLMIGKNPKSITPSLHGDTISEVHKSRAISDREDGKSIMTERKPIIWAENSMKPKPKEKKEGKIIDWLKEQRMSLDNGDKLASIQKSKDWKKDFEKMDLHGKEKYDMFLGKAKDFETKAQRKQEIIGVSQGATIEDIIELNDMYVESIKAKLELLNDFK